MKSFIGLPYFQINPAMRKNRVALLTIEAIINIGKFMA